MTRLGKVFLLLALLTVAACLGFVVWGMNVGVVKKLVQGTGTIGILALIAAFGILALDQAYRWTRQALRELRSADKPPIF